MPIFDTATLGEVLKMSGYAQGQLVGDDMRYARIGVALEVARFGARNSETQRRWMLDSATVYLGGETTGPVYLGAGMTSGGSPSLYLFLGVP